MHAHDPHHVLGLGGDLRLAQVGLLAQAVEEAQEAGQALALEGGELCGALVQVQQVGHALPPVAQAAAVGEVAGVLVDGANEVRERPAAGQVAPFGEFLEEPAQPRGQVVFLLACVPSHRFVKRRVGNREGEAHAAEAVFRIRQVRQRAAEHRRERHVLPLVVQHAQQRKQIAHLRRVEVPAAAVAVDRDGGRLEHLGVFVGLVLHRAEEDYDISEPSRPRAHDAVRPGLHHARRLPAFHPHQLPDAPGDEQGLALGAVQVGLVVSAAVRVGGLDVGVGRIGELVREQVQLDRRAGKAANAVGGGRELLARLEAVGLVVAQVHGVRRHQALEHTVHRFEQRPAAAEVGLEVDGFAEAERLRSELLLPVEKARRLGQAEAVDALFDVADAKQVGLDADLPAHALAAQQAQDRVLHLVDVLVLVHQHVPEPPVVGPRRRGRGEGGRVIRVAQGPQGEALQVGEVDHPRRLLRHPVAVVELLHEPEKDFRVRQHEPEPVAPLGRRKPEAVDPRPFLHRVADGIDGGLGHVLSGDVVSHGREAPRLVRRHLGRQRVHASAAQAALPFGQGIAVFSKDVDVFRKSSKPLDLSDRLVAPASQRRKAGRDELAHFAPELAVAEGPLGGLADAAQAPVDPAVAVDEAVEHVVDMDHPAEDAFVIAVAVGVDEPLKLTPRVQLVAVRNQLPADVDPEKLRLVAVQDAEGGIEANQVEVLAEQAGAEAVQRADAGAVEQGELAAQPIWRPTRDRGGPRPQRNSDPALHLCRRRFGERDDKQLVHVARLGRVTHQVRAPLRQHRRLPRAGGGGNQQAVAGGGDAAELRLGPARLGARNVVLRMHRLRPPCR